jgi:hypothetical protein
MERARARFMEAYRATTLRAQIADWQEAQVASAYLAALEQAHGNDSDAAEWIEWIREFVARLDRCTARRRCRRNPRSSLRP